MLADNVRCASCYNSDALQKLEIGFWLMVPNFLINKNMLQSSNLCFNQIKTCFSDFTGFRFLNPFSNTG